MAAGFLNFASHGLCRESWDGRTFAQNFAVGCRRYFDATHTTPLCKLVKIKSNGVDIMAGLAANVCDCGRGFR
jgi:hypothetical protein